MSTLDATPHCVPKAHRLHSIGEKLPGDVIVLILSSLHGQDIARCIAVCHSFADLIHSDLALQYRIELAQNGMVDGECSTLPVSERLQRLRQYSSNFKCGAFQHEDLTAHPDYVLPNRDLLGQLRSVIPSSESPSCALYNMGGLGQDHSVLYLSLFVPGSAQAGIPSSRSFFTVREAVKPGMVAEMWAMDYVEDLFVIVENTRISHQEEMDGRIPEVFIHFYLLSGLKTDIMTPHPAAMLPFIHLRNVDDSAKPKHVSLGLRIVRDYVVFRSSYYIEVYNWKTGQMVSRINVGKVSFFFVPLDEPYLLLFRCARYGDLHQDARIWIYTFSRSSSEPLAGRHICTLQLPFPLPGERIMWSSAYTGDYTEETTGHFRADSSRSVVALYTIVASTQNVEKGRAMCFLIPRSTIAAQIHAAELTSRQTSGGVDAGSASEAAPLADEPEPTPPCVPWADWGPRGCLLLHLPRSLFPSRYHIFTKPFGSRLAMVMFDGPGNASASLYVFDANPLVARSLRRGRRRRGCVDSEGAATPVMADADLAVVEDIEEVLPGVVDPECAATPYTVYRFPLPYSRVGPPGLVAVADDVRKVTMSMAGFTVQFYHSIEYEKRFQTSTV